MLNRRQLIGQGALLALAGPALAAARGLDLALVNARLCVQILLRCRRDGDVRIGFPVAPLDPLTGVFAAVTHETIDGANPAGWLPEQKVSMAQALSAYTRANAYAGFQEDRLGAIRPGYLADLTILDADLFAIQPDAIPKVRVLRTIVGGRERFGPDAQ